MTLIEDQLTDPALTVCRLAEQVGLSQRHFSRRFLQYAGGSPKRTILRMRIELACDLMQSNSNMEIKQVSADCGFADPYHFSTQFKRHTGLPPSQYRQNLAESA
jgi:transcriptional regulator GlxA family with amidase domain